MQYSLSASRDVSVGDTVGMYLREIAKVPLLNSLTERRRIVLEMHYGLNGREKHALDEIGQYLGVTRERARQIGLKAL